MLKRTITGVCLSAVVLAVIALQGYAFIGALTAALLLGLYETMDCLKHAGKKPVAWVVYLYGLALGVAQAVVLHRGLGMFESLAASQLVLAICVMLVFGAVVLHGRVDIDAIWSTLFPMVYPGMFYAAIYPMNLIEGKMLTVAALLLTFFVANLNDLFALVIGVKYGRHKLSPRISPKKTVEGAIAGLIAAVAFSVILPYGVLGVFHLIPALNAYVQPLPAWWQFALMGVFAGAASQFGDLAASLIKRHCGVKDFGSIFPGHGGIMDRIDGVLFSAVVMLIFFMMTGA